MSSKALFDSVIFDIDNVLIDTRKSYLETIRLTVEIFLTHGKIPLFESVKKKDLPSLLSANDVHQFKLLGGFNDDWDCCYGMLVYLLNLPVKERTLAELKKNMHFDKLSKEFDKHPVGVNGIVKKFKRPAVVKIETISRIFQEIYLGKEIFPAIEKKPLLYWTKKGLIRNENLIFKKDFLEKLKKSKIKLGIATGRPRFEAEYSLKEFGVFDLFDAMTTLCEVRKEEKKQGCSLRKPHPFSLIETASKISKKGRCIYVGDLPDDILAANAAKTKMNMTSCGFTKLAEDKKDMQKQMAKQNADFIIQTPSELLKVLGLN